MNSDSEAISSQLFSEELRLPSDFLVKSLGTCFTVNGSEIFTVFHTCCMDIDCFVFFAMIINRLTMIQIHSHTSTYSIIIYVDTRIIKR